MNISEKAVQLQKYGLFLLLMLGALYQIVGGPIDFEEG